MFEFLLKSQNSHKLQHSQLSSNELEKRYQELVVKHHIQSDSGQIKVLGHLQHLLDQISSPQFFKKRSNFDSSAITFSGNTKGLYLFGDVGRGKSMLMDVFYEACPILMKRRIHFHAFMQEVHEFMHQWRQKNEGDPIIALAKQIKTQSVLICFDELIVTDIVDAMLLARLFAELTRLGVVFVATSNHHPDDLYKNGLQRELFIPFIELIKQTCEVMELMGKEDYRASYFKSLKSTFYHSDSNAGDQFLKVRFDELTNSAGTEQKSLVIQGREVVFEHTHGDILWTSFAQLCDRPLGAADYLAIASEFKIILMSDIPSFTLEIRDQARRFVTLIDALYEKKVKLICSLSVPLEELHLEDKDFDLTRTRSRLLEMQTERYLGAESVIYPKKSLSA